MEFIAQFRSSVSGTIDTLFTDVFLIDGVLVLFKRSGRGNFELQFVENNSYLMHTKEFDDFLNTRELRSNDCNLLNIWRATKVNNPTLMPDRYYKDILAVYNRQRLIAKNNMKEMHKLLKKATDEINSYL